MTSLQKTKAVTLPLPPHYDKAKAEDWAWIVQYNTLDKLAEAWAKTHNIQHASLDKVKMCLLSIDPQCTFSFPQFELFVAGKSGRGAIDDAIRLSEFIYRNLPHITQMANTLDTHWMMQIFHPSFFINSKGEHPPGGTLITTAMLEDGTWEVNPAVVYSLAREGKVNYNSLKKHVEFYVKSLVGRFDFIVWPYHAIFGGFGHAVVPLIHEAQWFWQNARKNDIILETKGSLPLSENYSVLRPELLQGASGEPIGHRNADFFNMLISYDMLVIAGQAKSHCMAWSISDLLDMIDSPQYGGDPSLAKKIYLLEDCTSNVVIPAAGLDFSPKGDAAFESFRKRGVNIVKSTDPIHTWPNSPFTK